MKNKKKNKRNMYGALCLAVLAVALAWQCDDTVLTDTPLVGVWTNNLLESSNNSQRVYDTIRFDRDGTLQHLGMVGTQRWSYEVQDDSALMVHYAEDNCSRHSFFIRENPARGWTELFVTNNFKFDFAEYFLDTARYRKL